MSAIDLVLLWCDGGDPSWVAKKNARMRDLGIVPDADSVNYGDLRYVQHDELKYSLRSAAKFVPWINHIYIVTDGQTPKWFKPHKKVTIVDHKEIIPSELLPTFSSVTIEMYIDRIPGLSEKFIYGNDDMIFMRHLEPSDFFDGDRPIARLKKDDRFDGITMDRAAALVNSQSDKRWIITVLRAWMVALQKNRLNHKKFPFVSTAHSFDAYTKTLIKSVKEKYPQLLESNKSPIRTGEEIMRILYLYEGVISGSAIKEMVPRPDGFVRLLTHMWKQKMYVVYAHDVRRISRMLELFDVSTFCLNDLPNDAKIKNEVKDFFESRFPEKSDWEQ